jgi:hypothetical protein
MRQIIILLITTLTFNAFGQIDYLNPKVVNKSNKFEKTGNDTIPQVTDVNSNTSDRKPAYYINGKYINETIIKTINPQLIDSIHIVKKDVEIEGNQYYGLIYILLKKDYTPKLISQDLKLKYTNLINAPSIFMIDNEIISEDYNKCIVDEKYILKIIVEKVVIKEESLQVNIIRLLTKTEANIRKSKEISIRGKEDIMLEK